MTILIVMIFVWLLESLSLLAYTDMTLANYDLENKRQGPGRGASHLMLEPSVPTPFFFFCLGLQLICS